jgi:hypothetical protein
MPSLMQFHGHVRRTSRYTVDSTVFDVINYRTGLTANAGLPPNLTMTADTPNGVLSGSVAAGSPTKPWTSVAASYNSPAGSILGLFVRSAAGNAFENNQAAASGVIGIATEGGEMTLPYFETHTSDNGYASILPNYTYECALYVSPFGLLSPIQPSTLVNVYTVTPINSVVAICKKPPTATDLTLGIRLLPFALLPAGL